MIVRYARVGGRRPPPDNEGLEIQEDGSFSMWRSIAPAIGRFTGTLEASELSRLSEERQKAVAAGDLTREPARDGSVEIVDLQGARASLGSNDYAEGAWGTLIDHLRKLLDELIVFPRAAIALEVDSAGRNARLTHAGETPLTADLSRLSVRAVLWGRGYKKLGDWTSTGSESRGGQVEAANGWSAPLPFNHGLELGKGTVLHVYVNFAAVEKGTRTDVTAQHTPPIPE